MNKFFLLIYRLNKYGLCLEPKIKYLLLNDIGKQFIDNTVELVKAGHRFVYVLDNIGWEEKTHDTRQEGQETYTFVFCSFIYTVI